MELIHRFVKGGFGGRPAQVILTTHSPHLLDVVVPGEDQILVFSRDDMGRCTAREANAEMLAEFKRNEFLPGEVWFNEGESSLILPGKKLDPAA